MFSLIATSPRVNLKVVLRAFPGAILNNNNNNNIELWRKRSFSHVLIVDEKEKELLVPRNISSFFFFFFPGIFVLLFGAMGAFIFLVMYYLVIIPQVGIFSLSTSYIFINIDVRTTRSRRDTKMEYLGRLSANRRKEQKKKNTPLVLECCVCVPQVQARN